MGTKQVPKCQLNLATKNVNYYTLGGTRLVMSTSELLGFLQWPAMLATLIAAWLVASSSKSKRNSGFWWFIASNILWVVWGWHVQAYALIILQAGLLAFNVRGAKKSEPAA